MKTEKINGGGLFLLHLIGIALWVVSLWLLGVRVADIADVKTCLGLELCTLGVTPLHWKWVSL